VALGNGFWLWLWDAYAPTPAEGGIRRGIRRERSTPTKTKGRMEGLLCNFLGISIP